MQTDVIDFEERTRPLIYERLVRERRAAARARLVMRIAGLVAWEIDAATGDIIHDDGLSELFGVPDRALDGTMAPFVERINPDDVADVLSSFERAKVEGGTYRAEFRVRSSNEQGWRWLVGVGEGVAREDGAISVIGYNADVTHRLEREEALQAALDQNHWLRLEADHRIKNHLQMVSGLLDAQARTSSSEEVRIALHQAGARLHTVASIHRTLAEVGVQAAVQLDQFLAEIAVQTVAATDVSGRVKLSMNIEPLACPASFATNVAHILAELLTNSIKHGPSEGEFHVRVTAKAEGGAFQMKVSDDGPGLPQSFTMRGGGVGVKVINALARGLKGTVAPVDSELGATFLLDCPLPDR